MKKIYFLTFCFLGLISVSYGQFVENKGQVVDDTGKNRPDVKFTYQSNNSKLFFLKNKITYVLFESFHEETEESKSARERGDVKRADNLSLRIKQQHIDFNFLNSNPNVEIQFQEKKKYFQNFYLAHCPKGITKVPTYSKVIYKNIYNNIDIVFKSTKKGVKYDIILHPGANIADVRFQYDGVDKIKFEKDKIIFETDIFDLVENIPMSYFEETKKPVDIFYKDLKNGVFGFESENDFNSQKVIIDPALTWATYFEQTVSPNASYIGQNTHVDASGNFYFQICTYNSDLPSQNPGGSAYLDPSHTGGGIETYFAQFDANRNLIWSTYLGGSGAESNYYDHGLTDYGGSLFIAGRTTSTDFPVMNQGGGAFYQATRTTGTNAFFSKFNTSTGAMQHSTYLGYITQIVMDASPSGNIAIVGVAGSSSDAGTLLLQSRAGAYNQAFGGGNDVFVAQFNATTCVKNWGTFIGGPDYEEPMGVTYDNSNNLFLFNRAGNNTIPLLNPGGGAYYDNTFGDKYDMWFVKFNSSGALSWSTLYGGTGLEGLSYSKITVTANNHIVATTSTRSSGLSTTNPGGGAYFQSAPGYLTNGWGGDPSTGFMVRFNNNGVVQHATYMGHPTNGNGTTKGNIPAASGSHYFLLSMPTTPVHPVSCSAPDYCSSYTSGSSNTGYIMELDASYNMVWDSYLYSADRVFGESMTSDVSRSRVYVSGVSNNTSSPTFNPGGGAYYDNVFNGTTNAYNIMEFSACTSETNTTSTATICENSTKALTSSGAGGGTWSIVSGGGSITGTTYTPADIAVNTTVTVRYTDGCGTTSDRAFTVNYLPASNTTGNTAPVCEGSTKTLVATPGGGTWSVISGGGSITGSTYTAPSVASNTAVTVQYTLTNGTCVSNNTTGFTVTNSPGTANNTTSTAAICEGSTKALTGTPSGGTWSIVSGGGSITGSTYTSPSVASNTSVTIRYTIAATGGCPATTSDVVFTVNDNLGTANNTTSTASICEGSTKALTATPSGGTWSVVSGGGSITGSTYTSPAVASNTSVTVRYTIAANGSCPGSTSDVVFTVNDNPGTANNTTSTASICEGSTKALTATPSGGTWSVVSGGGSITGSTYTSPSVASNTSVTVRYTIAANGSCPGSTSDVVFTVNDNPGTANNTTSTASICEGSTKALTGTPSGGTWSIVSGGGSITGSTYTSPAVASNTSVTIRYTIAANGSCPGSTSDVVFTVNDNPGTANNTTSTASICEGSTKALTGTPSGGTWSVVSGGGSITGSTYTSPAVASNTSVTIRYTIAANGACAGSTSDVVFTVNDNPGTANNTTTTTAICEGSTKALTGTPSGGTWSIVSGGGSITGSTYTSPAVASNTSVTVRYTIAANGACSGSTSDVVFTVNDNPGTANNTTSTASICEGSTKALTGTPSGGTWSVVSGGGSITGSTYTSPAVASNTSVTVRYTIAANGSCAATTSDVVFTVNDNPGTASNTTSTASICEGSTKALSGTPGGGTWSIVSGGGSITGSTYTSPAVASNTSVTIRYTIAANGACAGSTSDVVFTVNDNPGTANNTTTTTAICEGSTKALTGTPSGGTWSVVSGGGSITGSTYTSPAVGANTSVTVRYTIAANGACGATTSDVVFVVNDNPGTASNTTSTASICEGSTKALSGTPGGGTWSIVSGGGSITGSTYTSPSVASNTSVTVRYTIAANGACPGSTSDVVFTVNDNPGTANNTTSTASICETSTKSLTGTPSGGTWSIISGGGSITGSTYTPPSVASNTSVTIRYTIAANGACVGSTDDVIFTVEPNYTPSIISSSFDMCTGDSRTLVGSPLGGTFSVVSGGAFGSITGNTLTANAVGTVQIRYRITNACGNLDALQSINIVSPSVANITSSTAAMCIGDLRGLTGTPSGGSFSVIGGPGYIGLNDTLTTTSSGTVQVEYQYISPCGITADTVSITVNPEPVVTITSANSDMCIGGTRALTGTPAAGTWVVLSGPGSITGSTLTTTGAGNIQIEYTASALGCPGSTTQLITVLGSSDATWTNPGNICESTGLVDLTSYLPGTSTPGGVWSGSPSVSSGGILNTSGLGGTTINIKYKVGPTPCADSLTQSITITTAPNASWTMPNPICETQQYDLDTLLSVGATTGGTWSILSGGGTLVGSVYTPANVASNTSASIRYTIAASGGCSAINQDESFTVNVQEVAINSTSTADICESSTKTLVGSPLGGTWTVVSGGGGISGNTYTPANVTVNTPVVVRYTIASNGACPATTADVSFNVNVEEIASNTTSTADICESTTKTLVGSPLGGTWSVVSGGGSIAGTTYTPANVTSNTPVVIRYTIAVNGGCPATTSDVSFNVNVEEIANNTTSTANICENSTKALTATPAGGTWSVVSGGGSITGTTYTPANVSANTSVTVRYTIAANGGCPATTSDVTFNVNVEEIANNLTSTADICENTTKTLVGSPLGGTWSVVSGGGSIAGTTYTPANVTSNTPVVIRYTIAANGGCSATTSDVSFNVNVEEIAVNTTSNASICESTTKALTGTPSGGTWSVVSGGGSITGATYTASSVNNDTLVTVRYTIAANGGCPATTNDVSFTVTNSDPANNLTSTVDICESTTKTLLGAPSGGTWSIVSGGGSIAGTTYTPANVTSNTPVVIRYTVGASGGCSTTTSDVSFNVNVEEIAVNTTSNASICESTTKALTGTPSGGTWSVVSGGGSITGATYTASSVNNDTLVTVRYTIAANGGCPATTSDVSFTVTNSDPANNLTSTVDICESTTKTLLGAPSGGTWSIVSGGGSIAGTTYTPANVTSNTPVVIRYTVGASGGCSTTTSDVSFNVNVEEIANNTTSTSGICETSTKTLSASPVGGTWSIINGGGSIVGSTYTPANVASNTLVTVRYTIAANGGCPATTSDSSFVVYADLGVATNTTTTDTICESSTKTLVATPIGGTWSIVSGGGSIAGTTYTPASISNDTNVIVRYTMPANGTCPATTSDVAFTVNADVPVAVNTTATDAICSSETKTLVGAPSGGVWSVVSGGGSIVGTTYTPAAVASPVNVTIRYEFTNGKCNSYSDITFTVNNISATPVITPLVNDSVCIDELVTINATVGGTGNTIYWYTNNSASGIPVAMGNTLTDNPTADITYYAFGESGQGCQSAGYDSVNVYTYVPSVAAASISATLDTICSGQSTTLTLSGGSLGKNAVWRWYEVSCGVGSSIGTGTSITVSPTSDESYFVRAEGLCDTTACTQFDVIVQNSVSASWTSPDSICLDAGLIDLSLYLAGTSTTGGTWTGTGVTGNTFDPQVNGLGTVTITYTVGVSPCIDMMSHTITIYNSLPANISDDYFSVTTGSTEILDVESNDITQGIVSITMLAQSGVAYVNNNRIVYVADSNYRGYDTIQYSVCDVSCSNTCDTAQIIIRLEKNVFDNPDNGNIGIWGVSPNQDGVNDVLYIDDLYNHPNNRITIYNRWGDEIFTSSPYTNNWNGDGFVAGHYFFVLEFLDSNELFKGIIYLKK